MLTSLIVARRQVMPTLFAVLATALSTLTAAESKPLTLSLWPQTPPGEKAGLGTEQDMTKPSDGLIAGRPVIRLGNVSQPTLTVYRPPADRDNRAAVLVCPGGGYHILAMDLEGTEICEWLNSIGVTGVLLKYRVPARAGQAAHLAPLQDAQRAMGLIREHAKDWGLDPNRIGVLGFSAGAHLAAMLSTNYRDRAYRGVEEVDRISCRPDFTVLVYPAYLTLKDEGDKVNPQVTPTADTPPMFIVITQDDPVRVENAVLYALALKQATVPVELHLYPSGGHGYGLRRTEKTVTTWPDRAAEWMMANGWLPAK